MDCWGFFFSILFAALELLGEVEGAGLCWIGGVLLGRLLGLLGGANIKEAFSL
jgi:hypothetical protein